MSYSVVLLLTLLVLLVSWIYSWSKKKYDHFKELNVPFRKPTFPLGNVGSFTEKTTNVMVWFKDIYLEYRETHPFVGIFVGFEPVVVVTDLDIIKCILTIRDYYHGWGAMEEHEDQIISDIFQK